MSAPVLMPRSFERVLYVEDALGDVAQRVDQLVGRATPAPAAPRPKPPSAGTAPRSSCPTPLICLPRLRPAGRGLRRALAAHVLHKADLAANAADVLERLVRDDSSAKAEDFFCHGSYPLSGPLRLRSGEQPIRPHHVPLDLARRHIQELSRWSRVEPRHAIAVQNCIACASGTKKPISLCEQVAKSFPPIALTVDGGTAPSCEITDAHHRRVGRHLAGLPSRC